MRPSQSVAKWLAPLTLGLVCVLQAGITPAYAQTSWRVKTEKGREVEMRDVQAGRFEIVGGKMETVGYDSRGRPVQKVVGGETKFFAEVTVPYKPNSGFGHRFTIGEIEAGDRIVLHLRTMLPRAVASPKGPTNIVETDISYTSADSGKRRSLFWNFRTATGKDMLGPWVRTVSQGGSPLVETRFSVVAP